jgi:hypothetical protein
MFPRSRSNGLHAPRSPGERLQARKKGKILHSVLHLTLNTSCAKISPGKASGKKKREKKFCKVFYM